MRPEENPNESIFFPRYKVNQQDSGVIIDFNIKSSSGILFLVFGGLWILGSLSWMIRLGNIFAVFILLLLCLPGCFIIFLGIQTLFGHSLLEIQGNRLSMRRGIWNWEKTRSTVIGPKDYFSVDLRAKVSPISVVSLVQEGSRFPIHGGMLGANQEVSRLLSRYCPTVPQQIRDDFGTWWKPIEHENLPTEISSERREKQQNDPRISRIESDVPVVRTPPSLEKANSLGQWKYSRQGDKESFTIWAPAIASFVFLVLLALVSLVVGIALEQVFLGIAGALLSLLLAGFRITRRIHFWGQGNQGGFAIGTKRFALSWQWMKTIQEDIHFDGDDYKRIWVLKGDRNIKLPIWGKRDWQYVLQGIGFFRPDILPERCQPLEEYVLNLDFLVEKRPDYT